jgi:HD superfamily phosphohydrolase
LSKLRDKGSGLNKRKILNDPVYGFITIPFEIIYDLIEHPMVQRLRRIQQLGLSNLVYPGANHTRFHHALGAVHLMSKAIHVLRSKGHDISEEEAEAATIAILLHDIGHGPFSHALESAIVSRLGHEEISLVIMEHLNQSFNGRLTMAIDIFRGNYKKRFLHNLVSSQLDVDRLDYLIRDSYFTGVHEGVIGYDRLIEMMDVVDDELVIEQKGIYSVEKFIVARRVMYWQVYLHKTVVCAEQMLIRLLRRAKYLARHDSVPACPPALLYFLENEVDATSFRPGTPAFSNFSLLDDTDIYVALKYWAGSQDKVLSHLSNALLNRKLFRIEMSSQPVRAERIREVTSRVRSQFHIDDDFDLQYFIFHDTTSNSAYALDNRNIKIKTKHGKVSDVAQASDNLNLMALADTVVKHYLCFPKIIG